jgi:menaquinone-dependent protoporphyrinogen oxidase
MSRILIVHASSHGQTRRIAEVIAERLRARGIEVELGDAFAARRGLPPPEDYDGVVLGSRIHMGRHASELIEYMVAHRFELSSMPTAFFSVSMAASTPQAGPDPQGYNASLFKLASWQPGRAVAFAGGLPYREYGRILRFVMKMLSARAGHPTDTSRNHDLTDWTAVRRFADAIADDVLAASMPDDAPLTVPLPSTMS